MALPSFLLGPGIPLLPHAQHLSKGSKGPKISGVTPGLLPAQATESSGIRSVGMVFSPLCSQGGAACVWLPPAAGEAPFPAPGSLLGGAAGRSLWSLPSLALPLALPRLHHRPEEEEEAEMTEELGQHWHIPCPGAGTG